MKSHFRFARTLLFAVILSSVLWPACAEKWYEKPSGAETRWSSFENPLGTKGFAAVENQGGKGHAFDSLAPGESKILLDVQGSGIIDRMWFTINDRSAKRLRQLKLEFFWDGAPTPAVSVPFGDFMGAILGRPEAFESELFANPEGRSFNCYIPMPFRKSARMIVTNESDQRLRLLFYDINYTLGVRHSRNTLYFHAYWRRENPTVLRRDFEILPRIEGSGRFLGSHIGVMARKENRGWWGEGEVKMYVDGDGAFPTLAGTGTEDYIGTGWGQGTFSQRYHGCLVADATKQQYTFYRYHVPDPVYFDKEIRVTIQQMGGDGKTSVIQMIEEGVPIVPVSVAYGDTFVKLLEGDTPVDLKTHDSPSGAWTNYYRRDDVCATAFFYLDRPENGLPPLAAVAERIAEME